MRWKIIFGLSTIAICFSALFLQTQNASAAGEFLLDFPLPTYGETIEDTSNITIVPTRIPDNIVITSANVSRRAWGVSGLNWRFDWTTFEYGYYYFFDIVVEAQTGVIEPDNILVNNQNINWILSADHKILEIQYFPDLRYPVSIEASDINIKINNPAINTGFRLVDENGAPLTNSKVCTYEYGCKKTNSNGYVYYDIEASDNIETRELYIYFDGDEHYGAAEKTIYINTVDYSYSFLDGTELTTILESEEDDYWYYIYIDCLESEIAGFKINNRELERDEEYVTSTYRNATYIDLEEAGAEWLKTLAPGEYEVRVDFNDHESLVGKIIIEGEDEPNSPDAPLSPDEPIEPEDPVVPNTGTMTNSDSSIAKMTIFEAAAAGAGIAIMGWICVFTKKLRKNR